jgi:lipid A 4'-phosphatase
MTDVDAFAPAETKFRRNFLICAAVLSMPLAAILIANPDIDLSITSAARSACPVATLDGKWCDTWIITSARKAFMIVFTIVMLATLVATFRSLSSDRPKRLERARSLFMLAVLVIGPGVVTNLVLKDNLGRARPRDVIEFGGTKSFTPPLLPSRECPRNCSFVSGEASSMFAVFFALALLLPPYRWGLLIGGIAAGSLAGVVRIFQGAHFLSDVVFAGIFMALTVSLLHIAIIGLWRDQRRTWSTMAVPLEAISRFSFVARAR